MKERATPVYLLSGQEEQQPSAKWPDQAEQHFQLGNYIFQGQSLEEKFPVEIKTNRDNNKSSCIELLAQVDLSCTLV